MTYVQSIVPVGQQANYNAAKIQVNRPKTIIPEGFNNNINDGVYTGVDIQVNEPTVDFRRDNTYDYPVYNGIVTYDMIEYTPIESKESNPEQNNTEIKEQNNSNNQTAFNGLRNDNSEVVVENADDIEEPKDKLSFKGENEDIIEEPVADENNKVSFKGENEDIIEEPVADENNKVSFKGENEDVIDEPVDDENKEVAFKGDKKKIDIVPAEDILPEVNISDVVSRLSSKDYDTQASQMAEIIKVMLDYPEKLNQYVVKDVFVNLINIAEKDTDNLTKPTEEQEQLRTKIMLNVAARESAEKDNNLENFELPYSLTDSEIEKAIELSDYELAERNKEYALDTIAILAKEYADEIEAITGNVVAITDLPGASTLVNVLKTANSPSLKIAAIDSLLYINRPEYKDEIETLLKISTKDRNPFVAQNATVALDSLS